MAQENGYYTGSSNTPDDEPTPIIPPSPSVDPDLPNIPVLRPESGAYIANSEAWAKMHMRLHDRFGQAYYIDPFDGEEKEGFRIGFAKSEHILTSKPVPARHTLEQQSLRSVLI